MLDPPHKVLNSDLEVSGRLVDLLGVTLSGLSQLLCCLQQLVCVGVCVLKEVEEGKRVITFKKQSDIVCSTAVTCLMSSWTSDGFK